LPRRIECFDISTIQGSETVASLVVCEDGRMKRAEYRKFRIRGLKREAGGLRLEVGTLLCPFQLNQPPASNLQPPPRMTSRRWRKWSVAGIARCSKKAVLFLT
jgi:hypothetical protein